MTQKSKTHKKSAFTGRSIRGSDIGVSSEDVGVPVRNVHDVGIPSVHILSKNDIENELSQIEKKFGMTSEQFYKAWREGKVHGHEAVKLGSYFEFYKDEYE